MALAESHLCFEQNVQASEKKTKVSSAAPHLVNLNDIRNHFHQYTEYYGCLRLTRIFCSCFGKFTEIPTMAPRSSSVTLPGIKDPCFLTKIFPESFAAGHSHILCPHPILPVLSLPSEGVPDAISGICVLLVRPVPHLGYYFPSCSPPPVL